MVVALFLLLKHGTILIAISTMFTLKNFDGGSLSTPSIGVAYEIGISKNRQKWAMYTELVYNRYNQSYDNDKIND